MDNNLQHSQNHHYVGYSEVWHLKLSSETGRGKNKTEIKNQKNDIIQDIISTTPTIVEEI